MAAESAVSASLQQIPVGQIVESATNPRTHFDGAALEELAESIRVSGIQSPITVRPISALGLDRRYEIVAGGRRFRAAKLIGLQVVPCLAREMSDAEAREWQVVENLQRADLGPMEEAEGFAVLAKERGFGSVELAARVGKSAQYIHQRVKLLDLIPAMKELLRKGDVPLGYALEICRLGEAEQEHVIGWLKKDAWGQCEVDTLAELRRAIENEFRLVLKKAPFKLDATNLHPTAPACLVCPKRTGADALLFGDVKGDDRCLDPGCFRTKVKTLVHIKVAELTKKTGEALLVSSRWELPKDAPAGTLSDQKYRRAQKPHQPCDKSVQAVMTDGEDVGRIIKVCIDPECKVHWRNDYRRSGGGQDGAARKAELLKEKIDAEVWRRTGAAYIESVMADDSGEIGEDPVIWLADYAFRRADHANDGKLAKLLGWDRELLGWTSEKRKEHLERLGASRAAALALLAFMSVEELAPLQLVNATGIRRMVESEFAAKAKPAAKKVAAKAVAKAAAKKVPAKKGLTSEQKKNIADAMAARFAARRKAADEADYGDGHDEDRDDELGGEL